MFCRGGVRAVIVPDIQSSSGTHTAFVYKNPNRLQYVSTQTEAAAPRYVGILHTCTPGGLLGSQIQLLCALCLEAKVHKPISGVRRRAPRK